MSNKTLAKNTIVLYVQMFITLIVSLYTSRVILNTLGVSDYGLYNVVGGFIMMFGFLNNAMATATARFITFNQGIGNLDNQKKVFSTAIIIHMLIAIIVIIIAETFGLWFLNNKMVIDLNRLHAANWVYQAAIISFAINVGIVPFTSSIIAHEKMQIYAFVNVFDVLLKLGIVLVLPYFSFDKLIVYSILLLCITIINYAFYNIYCRHSFKECRLILVKDYKLLKEMLSFAGWSFVGNFGISAKDYGVNVVLNLFYGTTVNAARGVALQVSSAINGFVANFQTAVTPQITKKYAAGEKQSMLQLVQGSSKFSFFFLGVIIIPVIFRAQYIMSLWLVSVPEYAVIFLQLFLLMNLINSMYGPISTAMLATGNIRNYQIIVSVIMFMDVPLSYLILSLGAKPFAVIIIGILSAFVALLARILLLSRAVGFQASPFITKVVLRNLTTFISMFFGTYIINKLIPSSLFGLFLFVIISCLLSLAVIYFIGLNKSERIFFSQFVLNKIHSLNAHF